jgi:hypothetical protein
VARPPDPAIHAVVPGRLRRAGAGLASRIAAAVGGGAVALVFSELVFLNEGPVSALRPGAPGAARALAELLAFYAAFAYVARVVTWGCYARGWAGLVLSGAILGWLIEGTAIAVVHEAPPISWVWPSLGWHMLVTFGAGWVLLPWLMRRAHPAGLAAALAAAGLAWAAWGRVFYAEDAAMTLPTPGGFAGLAALAGLLLVAGTWLSDRPWARFAPGRGDALAAAALALPIALAQGWSAGPVALGLGGMVGATLWALWRLRAPASPPPAPPPARSYALLVVLPVAASAAILVLPEAPPGLSPFVVLPMTLIAALAWLAAVSRAVFERARTAR